VKPGNSGKLSLDSPDIPESSDFFLDSSGFTLKTQIAMQCISSVSSLSCFCPVISSDHEEEARDQ
jgi:hypothetical protein